MNNPEQILGQKSKKVKSKTKSINKVCGEGAATGGFFFFLGGVINQTTVSNDSDK
jgi:hypothetical protein